MVGEHTLFQVVPGLAVCVKVLTVTRHRWFLPGTPDSTTSESDVSSSF